MRNKENMEVIQKRVAVLERQRLEIIKQCGDYNYIEKYTKAKEEHNDTEIKLLETQRKTWEDQLSLICDKITLEYAKLNRALDKASKKLEKDINRMLNDRSVCRYTE